MEVVKAIKQNDPQSCKGLIYRAYIESYMGKRGEVVRKVSFKPMKRLSCAGCGQCGYTLDDLQEGLEERDNVEGFDNAKDGELYKLRVVIDGYDYESGIADDWHVEFVPYIMEE